jgi:hypothetical protein
MLDGMGGEQMRAADADRQAVADKLRIALGEGRLELHEYDERVQRAYSAKTYGDLSPLLADLPDATAKPVAPVVAHPTATWLQQVWGSWVPVAVITTVVWMISSIGSNQLIYYWPVWVIGPWAAILAMTTVSGLASGAPRRMVEERERRALEKERRRARKAELAAERPGTDPTDDE